MPLSLMTPIGKSSESNSTPTIEHVLSFQALPNNTYLSMNKNNNNGALR